MMRAFQSFIGDPIRHRRFDLAWYRFSQLMHDRTNGAFDSAYMGLARMLRPKVGLPTPIGMAPRETATVIERLRQDGYMVLPFQLSGEQIAALTAFAYSTPAHAADISRNIAVSPGHVPPGVPRFSWWMHDLVRLPVIQKMIVEGPYCAIAQEYLGCRPILAHVSLFLDAPFDGYYEPYIYHYDNEGPAFLKFFFYLTDVEVGTGAHYFIAGTQAHAKPQQFARATLYKEEDLFGWYPRDREVAICGPAGTILAEDTAGFHRGSVLQRDFRLLMQFEFSAVDVPTGYELARKLVPVPVPGLHPGIASIARKFFKAA